MRELTGPLGLDDTPVLSDDGGAFVSLLDVVKAVKFTTEGWAHIKKLIVNDESVSQIPLFQRILAASDDDTMVFTAMIAIPYGLARVLEYDKAASERLVNYFAAAFVISMSRGYDLGREDERKARKD